MPVDPSPASSLPADDAPSAVLPETFTTGDSDAAAEYLAAVYDRSLWMSRLDGTMRHVRLDAGPFALDDMDLPGDLEYGAESLGLLVMDVRAGEMERTVGRSHDAVAAGDLLLSAVPAATWTGRSRDLDARVVRLDPSVLYEVAPAPRGGTEPVRFTSHRPVTPGAARHWKRTVGYVGDLLADLEATASPLVLGSAARLVAATVLATFPNTAVLDPTIADRTDAHPAALRRAVVFIEENVQADIGLADVAEAAHVTARAIQFAFRRHLDTTPTNYLRRLRLAHARSELLAADPADGVTVTAVATRWGFGHPGRFAAAYRAAYGEWPRTTLYR